MTTKTIYELVSEIHGAVLREREETSPDVLATRERDRWTAEVSGLRADVERLEANVDELTRIESALREQLATATRERDEAYDAVTRLTRERDEACEAQQRANLEWQRRHDELSRLRAAPGEMPADIVETVAPLLAQLHALDASQCPCQSDAEDPGPHHVPACPWSDPDYDPDAGDAYRATEFPEGLAALDKMRHQRDVARACVNVDMTGLAQALSRVASIAKGSLWIRDGENGSYSSEDDPETWLRRETGDALEAIISEATDALRLSGDIANIAFGRGPLFDGGPAKIARVPPRAEALAWANAGPPVPEDGVLAGCTTITREDVARDPGAVVQRAMRGEAVTVIDAEGKPRMVVSVPSIGTATVCGAVYGGSGPCSKPPGHNGSHYASATDEVFTASFPTAVTHPSPLSREEAERMAKEWIGHHIGGGWHDEEAPLADLLLSVAGRGVEACSSCECRPRATECEGCIREQRDLETGRVVGDEPPAVEHEVTVQSYEEGGTEWYVPAVNGVRLGDEVTYREERSAHECAEMLRRALSRGRTVDVERLVRAEFSERLARRHGPHKSVLFGDRLIFCFGPEDGPNWEADADEMVVELRGAVAALTGCPRVDVDARVREAVEAEREQLRGLDLPAMLAELHNADLEPDAIRESVGTYEDGLRDGAKAEREACAAVAEENAWRGDSGAAGDAGVGHCGDCGEDVPFHDPSCVVAMIRARGEGGA